MGKRMYKVEKPKIHLSEICDYDERSRQYYTTGADLVFGDEKEVALFLASRGRCVSHSFDGEGQLICQDGPNFYMVSQALSGLQRLQSMLNETNIHEKYYVIPDKPGWKLDKYLFWYDHGACCSLLDVRKLKDEIQRLERAGMEATKKDFEKWGQKKRAGAKHYGRGCQCHTTTIWGRGRTGIGVAKAATDDEYGKYAPPKDRKNYKGICWDDKTTRAGTGWKDNHGNRYRHQWEAKAAREEKREKKRFQEMLWEKETKDLS